MDGSQLFHFDAWGVEQIGGVWIEGVLSLLHAPIRQFDGGLALSGIFSDRATANVGAWSNRAVSKHLQIAASKWQRMFSHAYAGQTSWFDNLLML